MPTTYTSLLGLSLPATGELGGTWGNEVNNGITSLLDSAVAGTTTLSTDADVTLTTVTGASNQARQAIVLCTGARTVTRAVTAPAQSKTYVVINATTGGQAITFRAVGPTAGVSIANGERAVVAWNGSDFVKVGSTGGVVASTDGTAAAPGFTFASDADTGLFSPGANQLGISTAGLERMRLDSSGNLGIGTSAPNSSFGRTLHLYNNANTGTVASNATLLVESVNRNSTIELAMSNSGNGGVQFSSPLGTIFSGMYGEAATQALFFRTGGPTERMRITAAGNLGLGSSSPIFRLDVLDAANSGVARVLNNTPGSFTEFYVASNDRSLAIGQRSSTNAGGDLAYLYSPTATPIAFFTNTLERMRIDASGNLLVGTTNTPSISRVYVESTEARIQSRNTTSGANGYVGAVNPNEWRVWTVTNTDITFGTNNAERMRIAGTGAALTVLGNAVISNTAGEGNLSIVGSIGTLVLRARDTGSGTSQVGVYTPSGMTTTPFVFTLADVERMRITAAGNIVAGGSAALATTATDGFLYVPTCAGTPTGVPTAITGMAPIVVNTTNNKLFFYSGGAWRDAGP